MKFLSSTSSSAASTTTSSSASPKKRSLTQKLRKLLCFNSLPTNTTNQFQDTGFNSGELDNFMCLETEEKLEVTKKPGIVARLMGLESMPQVARCHSMNYDSRRENEGQHQLVNTSLSFRELPTFLNLESEFFVLSFDTEVENKEFSSNANGSEMGSRKLEKGKGERSKSKCDRRGLSEEKDKENQEPNMVVADEKINRRINQNVIKLLKPIIQRETSSGRKQSRDKEKIFYTSKAVEAECSLENLSPVSILDFCHEPITDPHVPKSEGSTSRRKISAELENCKHSPPSPHNPCTNPTADVEKWRLVDGKCQRPRRKDKLRQKYVGKRSSKICKIAKEAMMESNWLYKELWKLEDFEGTGADFELQILETMLNELVVLLVQTSQKNFSL